jgi:solute carrier family 35 protein F1/2
MGPRERDRVDSPDHEAMDPSVTVDWEQQQDTPLLLGAPHSPALHHLHTLPRDAAYQTRDKLLSGAPSDDGPPSPASDNAAVVTSFGPADLEPKVLLCLSKRQLYALVLGQILSLLITSTGISSQLLAADYQTSIPVTQGFLNYVLLSLYSAHLVWHGQLFATLRARWWQYLLLALIDVEANYLVVMAYQYTNIGSVMLLDCWSIPVVMVLAYIFLRTRFRLVQYLAVIMCIIGLVLLVISDILKGESLAAGSQPWLGDVLCLAGATLYGISNVCQEAFVKQYSSIEYLAMIGLFGTLIGAIQMLATESALLGNVQWSAPVIGLICAFGVSMFLLYSLVPTMLRLGGATFYNVSLLTSDFFAVIVQIWLFHDLPNWVYAIAFFVIIVGLLVYHLELPCLQEWSARWPLCSDSRAEDPAVDGENVIHDDDDDDDDAAAAAVLIDDDTALVLDDK